MDDILITIGRIFSQHADAVLKWGAGILFSLIGAVFTHVSRKRVEKEDEKQRETHTLDLFRALSSSNTHLQLATASVLVERLKRLKAQGSSRLDESEAASIEQGLQSMLKSKLAIQPTGTAARAVDGDGIDPLVTKYIADQIVIMSKALPLAEGRPADPRTIDGKRLCQKRPSLAASPLKRFDWQKVKIAEAWWPGIDARGVDFYMAELVGCGMRFAHLDGATFYAARLSKSKLNGANLTKATFYEADLDGVDFRDAILADADLTTARNWQSARWEGALISAGTKLPDGLTPERVGMRSSDAPRQSA